MVIDITVFVNAKKNSLNNLPAAGTSLRTTRPFDWAQGGTPLLGMRTDGSPTPDPSRGIGMTL